MLNDLICENYSSLFGLESGERFNFEELDVGVELLLGFFILVLGSANSKSDESWNVSATLGLDESVQLSVHSDIL